MSSLDFNYKNFTERQLSTTPLKPQQPTDPTRTILTWREFSDKVEDRVDALSLSTISTEVELEDALAMLVNDLLDMFDIYLMLMMRKGILFAVEHMNRLDPKYHFEVGWGPSDDVLLDNLLAGCEKYLTNWTADIRTEAAEEIREGLAAGETIEQIGMRVGNTLQRNKARGTLIARTELMRAWNQAAYDRYNKAGFDIIWMTARDVDVCDMCEDLEKKPIAIIGFTPPAHPNCRCGILPTLPSPM